MEVREVTKQRPFQRGNMVVGQIPAKPNVNKSDNKMIYIVQQISESKLKATYFVDILPPHYALQFYLFRKKNKLKHHVYEISKIMLKC